MIDRASTVYIRELPHDAAAAAAETEPCRSVRLLFISVSPGRRLRYTVNRFAAWKYKGRKKGNGRGGNKK